MKNSGGEVFPNRVGSRPLLPGETRGPWKPERAAVSHLSTRALVTPARSSDVILDIKTLSTPCSGASQRQHPRFLHWVLIISLYLYKPSIKSVDNSVSQKNTKKWLRIALHWVDEAVLCQWWELQLTRDIPILLSITQLICFQCNMQLVSLLLCR